MADSPPVARRDIPAPGECVGDNESLVWHCIGCGQVSPLLQLHCGNCFEERPEHLMPWVKLAERDHRLTSPLGGKLNALDPPHTPAFARFVRSMKLQYEHWDDGVTYDLSALAEVAAWERPLVARLMTSHEMTWREVEVWDQLDQADSIAQLQAASESYLHGDVRLAAAAALDRRGRWREPIDLTIAREIRQLNELTDGTRRAMALAIEHPTEAVKQALLYASVCTTTSAPECARTLATICGKAGPAVEEIAQGIGLHVSHFTRQAAFEKLCTLMGMKLEI